MSESATLSEDTKREMQENIIRLALLHLAFSRVLLQEHGRERGLDLIAKAMIEYGRGCAERPDPTLNPISFGLYNETGETAQGKYYVRGCLIAKVFKEQDALDIGHMYCYVDAAKMMAKQPEAKMIHITCETCGDDKCTVDIVPTTEKDRETFSSGTGAWRKVDPRLYKYDKGAPSLKGEAIKDNQARKSSHPRGPHDT